MESGQLDQVYIHERAGLMGDGRALTFIGHLLCLDKCLDIGIMRMSLCMGFAQCWGWYSRCLAAE